MVLIRRVCSKTKSCYIVQTTEQTALFDYPADIYGKNWVFPSLVNEQKPLKLVLPKLVENIDHIFITKPDSLGVFFLERDIPIYITEPVFEQMLLKFKSLSELAVHYEDEKEDGPCVCIGSGCVERFKKNVKLICFNEKCQFDGFSITPIPAGTFIGWPNYLIELEDRKTICYLTSLFNGPRLSSRSVSISSDYLIVNIIDFIAAQHQMDDFSAYIKTLGKKQVAVIPLEETTLLTEVLLHVLFLLQNKRDIPVHVASPAFHNLCTAINIQCDWLSEPFSSSREPFPVRTYEKLFLSQNLTEVKDVCSPAIVFCDSTEFCLFPSKIFTDQETVSINNSVKKADYFYHLKLEMSVKEITSGYLGKTVIDIEPNRYFHVESSIGHRDFFVNGRSIQVHENEAYFHGKFKFSDADNLGIKRITFAQKMCKLNTLFAKHRFYFRNGAYYFPTKGIKVMMKKDSVTVFHLGKKREAKESKT